MAWFDEKRPRRPGTKAEDMPPAMRRPRPDEEPRRRRDEEEHQSIDPEFIHPGRRLLHLMRDLDAARANVISACGAINEHLDEHEELKAMWEDFKARGGFTAIEMSTWLVDDDWRRKDMVLRKKHRMLIETRDEPIRKKSIPRPRLRRRPHDDPPEAA